MAETVYKKASEIVAQRKKDREEKLLQRKREVFSKIPRLKEIENELDRYGTRMLNMIIDGKCDTQRAVAGIMAENRAYVEEQKRLLSVHGYSENYLEMTPFCKKCGDTGYIDNKLCSCIKQEMTKCALKDANLTDSLAKQTFDSFNVSYYSNEFVQKYGCSPRQNILAILKECQDFAKSFPNTNENLLLCGDCGTGKTYLSSAICHELIGNGADVLYISSNSLFPILEDIHFGRNITDRAQYLVGKLNECELLILDDLGSEFVTQFTCAELFRIINYRLINDKNMIISTNLNRSMLSKTYGERIASRITGSFEFLEFFGKDIRTIKKLEGKI